MNRTRTGKPPRRPRFADRLRPRPTLSRVGVALALVLVGQALLWPDQASAAVALTVTTTADTSANGGACGNSSTTAPSPLSLREATCIATNYGISQAVTINIPAGHYTLFNGELQPGKATGSNVSLVGAGSASTIIDGNNNSRVLDFDSNIQGGVTNSVTNLTITGGKDDTFGGAGVIAGSNLNSSIDRLTLNNVAMAGNHANTTTPNVTNRRGGALQFEGGQLTITNSTFSNNSAGSSDGQALYYLANGAASPESLTITGSTFSGNSDATTTGDNAALTGGAVTLAGLPGTSYTLTNDRFTGNSVTSSAGNGSPVGGAIYEKSGQLTVTGSTFTSNSVSGGTASPAGGAVDVAGAATAAFHYDRFTGNSGPTGSAVASVSSVTTDLKENWWGCSTGPGTAGCDTVSGTVTDAPRLVLTATASPVHVIGPNGSATLTASLLTDSGGNAVAAADLVSAFDTVPVSFADPPGDATVTGTSGAHSANLSNGVASIDYHSGTTLGQDNDSVTLDNGTVTDVLEVDEPPTFTSADTGQFTTGTSGTFTITTSGYPTAAITKTGSLPPGLTFHDNGDGSATISGTPGAGTGGNYSLELTAANGYAPNATQTLNVKVVQPAGFTSPARATFVIGSAGSFTVTTSGVPTVPAITESGTLPAGITFTDNGDGTATIAGTPAGTGNTYPVLLAAANGVTPKATQNLTIQVNQAPSITLNPSDQTVTPGNSVSFTAAASGVPTPTVQWQQSTDGGSSFANVSGATSTTYTFNAATGDDGNQYRAVFSNGVGSPATTAATLTVGVAPSFTTADHTSFVVGSAGSFSITTTGLPSATLSWTGTQFPAWLTLTDNGDGTGALTGTPPAGRAGIYQFTLKAANGFSPSASQTFSLFVDDSPVITSPDHTRFTAGQADSLAVTTTAGFPTTTALSETGSLPSGVIFHDNGDGTATLAGTPGANAGGSYAIRISATAVGGLAAPAAQDFTLTVLAPPQITSAEHATFSEAWAGSFTVATSAGNPSATTLTSSGPLPAGVSFTDNGDGTATIAGTPNVGSQGVYTFGITAGNGVAPDATQTFILTVTAAPQITSADHATFAMNTAAAFTVTTLGVPTSSLSKTGSLPPGMTFTDNGDGTATLGGTPTTDGSYSVTIAAGNGVLPDATQSFTATVDASPAISSADRTTFAVGSSGSFRLTTTPGVPTATAITESGRLPSGVTFTDNGDGTATLAGTPAAGTGGSYPLTITAGNGVLPNATQSFTLTVTQLPAITSAGHTTFTVGSAGTFTVTTSAGYPPGTTIAKSGSLSSGVTFSDNGDGTATLAGTPAAGTAGSYPLALTARDSIGHTDQVFTLTVVRQPQSITVASIPPSAVVGGSYVLGATSDAGLNVMYSIDAATTNSACSLTASTVSFDAAGSCVVDFDQPGNGTFAPAVEVQQSMSVTKIRTAVSVTTSPTSTVYGQYGQATATVTTGNAAPSGTVQFSVDGTDLGAPVLVSGGTADSPVLTTADGAALPPGPHTVSAVFTPHDNVTYAASTGSSTQVVDQAATTTGLTVHAHNLRAGVATVPPGAGTPTGRVRFSVGSRSVGTAPLVNGVATLAYTVETGRANTVAAAYSGNEDFTPSSVSTARRDPKITAQMSSTHRRTRLGWYRSPVTVTFTCTPEGAPLTAPCPAPVVLHHGAGRSVTRTISASDGGEATVVVSGINIDRTHPRVSIAGARDGEILAAKAPRVRCVASDRLSGVASCQITKTARGTHVTYQATATDRAGNVSRTRLTVRVLRSYLAGAPYVHGAFTVHVGHVYTFVMNGATGRPVYYDAVVYPGRPSKRNSAFHRAGHHRWTISVSIRRSLRTHPYWNIGARTGGTIHVIRIRIRSALIHRG